MYNRLSSQLKQGFKSSSSAVRSTMANTNRRRSAALAAGAVLTPTPFSLDSSSATTSPPTPPTTTTATTTTTNTNTTNGVTSGQTIQTNGLSFSSTTSSEKRASRDGAAVKVSEEILGDVPLVQVEKVLVVGSGGLSIGQAGEFDYSG